MKRRLAAVFGAWLFGAASAQAALPDHSVTLTCEGASSSGGYPFGIQTNSATRTLVILEDGEITENRENLRQKICRENTKCQVSRSSSGYHVVNRDVPGHIMYSESLDMDFGAGTFHYGGGGLDGGWGFQGTCHVQAPPEPPPKDSRTELERELEPLLMGHDIKTLKRPLTYDPDAHDVLGAPPDLLQTKGASSMSVKRAVAAGDKIGIFTFFNLNADCTPVEISIRITTPPSHGALTIEQSTVNFDEWRPRMAAGDKDPRVLCTSHRYPGLTVQYAADAGFIGVDRAVIVETEGARTAQHPLTFVVLNPKMAGPSQRSQTSSAGPPMPPSTGAPPPY